MQSPTLSRRKIVQYTVLSLAALGVWTLLRRPSRHDLEPLEDEPVRKTRVDARISTLILRQALNSSVADNQDQENSPEFNQVHQCCQISGRCKNLYVVFAEIDRHNIHRGRRQYGTAKVSSILYRKRDVRRIRLLNSGFTENHPFFST